MARDMSDYRLNPAGRTLESNSLVDEVIAKELSRRQMVRGVMTTTVGGWLGAVGLAACGDASNGNAVGTIPGGQLGDSALPSGRDAGIEPPEDSRAVVNPTAHLVGMGWHEQDRNAAMKAALDETVGLRMIKPGQSVYLRVNSNSGDKYPYSTAPETLLAVGGMLRDMGVTDLRIGDRSFWGDTDTAGNLRSNGIAGAATTLGTTAMVFDDTVDWVTLPPGSVPHWKGTVRLPAAAVNADHMIILSCVKTHFIATITMSLKISLGLVHPSDRAREGNLKNHDTRVLYKQTAQINKAFTPSLIIQDGYSTLASGGPTKRDRPSGAPAGFTPSIVNPKIFIVSTDRIAADVAGIGVLQTLSPAWEAVMKTTPFKNPQILESIAAGLGITGPEAFDLSGPTVPMIDEYRAKVLA